MKKEKVLKRHTIIKLSVIFVLSVCFMMSMTACGRQARSKKVSNVTTLENQTESTNDQVPKVIGEKKIEDDSENTQESTTENTAEKIREEAIDGNTYNVVQDWQKSVKYSLKNTYFYIRTGEEDEREVDNISINIGKNRYGIEDHPRFRQAILAQLSKEIGTSDISIQGEGTNTDDGDILYIFTMTDLKDNIITKQYYIIGDHRFCLIQSTNLTGSTEIDTVAEEMANSFKWKD